MWGVIFYLCLQFILGVILEMIVEVIIHILVHGFMIHTFNDLFDVGFNELLAIHEICLN